MGSKVSTNSHELICIPTINVVQTQSMTAYTYSQDTIKTQFVLKNEQRDCSTIQIEIIHQLNEDKLKIYKPPHRQSKSRTLERKATPFDELVDGNFHESWNELPKPKGDLNDEPQNEQDRGYSKVVIKGILKERGDMQQPRSSLVINDIGQKRVSFDTPLQFLSSPQIYAIL